MSETPTIKWEVETDFQVTDVEDGGCFLGSRIAVWEPEENSNEEDWFFFQIGSYRTDQNHEQIEQLRGKRIRVTVEVLGESNA
jgi:hypothetical protein